MKLLILESNVQEATRRFRWFSAQNYLVHLEARGVNAPDALLDSFDIILLGRLPDVSGTDLCRTYRQKGGLTPILMISNPADAKRAGNSSCVASALDSGANDFVPHDCSLSEISARIRAILRRPPDILDNDLLQAGDITLDTTASVILKGNREIVLQPMELSLLEFFMRHPNQTFTSHALHERLWKARITKGINSDTVRTHIKTLRKKIDHPAGKSMITLVHGKGYKLTPPEDVEVPPSGESAQ